MKCWTDETETYIADAFRRCDPHATGQPDEYHRSNARAVLKYLADVGALLPPGGVTRDVFDVETRGVHWPGYDTEAAAWEQLARVKAWPEAPRVRIVRRTVTDWPDGRRHVSPSEYFGGDTIWDGAP